MNIYQLWNKWGEILIQGDAIKEIDDSNDLALQIENAKEIAKKYPELEEDIKNYTGMILTKKNFVPNDIITLF